MPTLQHRHFGGLEHQPAGAPLDRCARVGVRREALAGGDAGIRRTVDVMRALVRTARGQPRIRAWAERAVAGVRPGETLAEIVAVRDWLADRVEYRRDPSAVEWLQAPWYVLDCQVARGRRPQLDCDDLTVLSLSLLEAVGHRTAFRVVSHRPDGQFNHVYGLDLTLPGRPVKVDMVDAWRPLGRTAPPETRAMEIAA